MVPVFMNFDSIYDAHGAFTAAVTPPLVVTFVFSLFWKRFTSKAALVGLTKAISMEFLERGVTCNCVVPGFIEDFSSKEKKLKGHWLRHPQTPNLVLKRFGNPEEVAEVIANLCKKEASYINGQTLHVNGGSYTP